MLWNWSSFPRRVFQRFTLKRIGLLAIYVLATIQVVGAYQDLVSNYLNDRLMEHGYERLPFQTRLLLIPLYRWAAASPWLQHYASRQARNKSFYPNGMSPEEVLSFFIGIVCVMIAGWVTVKLYKAATQRLLLGPLVYPLFLGLCAITYILHTVQNYRYLYDLPSLAFFSVGLYLIYFRKSPLWFAALFAIATLNRETTLFLLPFYMLTAAIDEEGKFLWPRMFSAKVMSVVLPLLIYWVGWHVLIFHIFRYNRSEYYSRVSFNLFCLMRLRYYPQLLSAFGYLLPFLILFRRHVRDAQLRVWMWILPLWIGCMFYLGIVAETRVFGELMPFVACISALIAEEVIARRLQSSRGAAIVGFDSIAGTRKAAALTHIRKDTKDPGYAANSFISTSRVSRKLAGAGPEEIVRQKDPKLRLVVEQLARGQVGEAVENLDRQGRVHEVKDYDERIAAIAKEYVKLPESTLAVAPDNLSRTEINERIHTELQAHGLVSKEEHRIRALVLRQDLTRPERTWAARYRFNDVLRYARPWKEANIERGEYARVKSIDARNNLLTVVRADGTERTYDPSRRQEVFVYREEQRRFSVGDRIQFTASANNLGVANRELGTVEAIGQDGRLKLKMDRGRDVELDPHQHPHLDHGYAVTSHSSQRQTADRVLIHIDTERGTKDLLNSRMAYISVSRGAWDAQLFTNDREKMSIALRS